MPLSVAIPDSSISDEPTRESKARKASTIARACAIFGVRGVYVYGDRGTREDASLLVGLLRHAETPQYLRRVLYPRIDALRHVGVMHPLQIPSHTVPRRLRDVRAGDVREGVVAASRGGMVVDVGIGRALPYRGGAPPGSRVTVRMRAGAPSPDAKEIPRAEAPSYWGYDVRARASLAALLRSWDGPVILTSRKGRARAASAAQRARRGGALVAFGAPDRGLPEILGAEAARVQNATTVNFFPNQRTATVRLEEAILGVLAILDAAPEGGGVGP